jgi:hypothetical protein
MQGWCISNAMQTAHYKSSVDKFFDEDKLKTIADAPGRKPATWY